MHMHKDFKCLVPVNFFYTLLQTITVFFFNLQSNCCHFKLIENHWIIRIPYEHFTNKKKTYNEEIRKCN